MYLLALVILYPTVYAVMLFGVPLVGGTRAAISYRKSAVSVAVIVVLYLAVYAFNAMVKDPEISNWVLHTWGGGALAVGTYFLAVRDSGVQSTTLQFFVFGFLVATALGVANELVEFFLQSQFGLIFAESVDDTWVDLTNNTLGALLTLSCLWLFAGSRIER
jgi:hypothetical protein